ncbi:MAG: hypothetical protein RL301_940 [Actinomycetota bacterium]
MKNVAVTGAGGFIGTHLINELNSKSWNIRWAVDNLNPPYGNDLSEARLNSISNIVNLDKSDLNKLSIPELVQKLKDSEIVIHLAAFAGVRLGEEKPYDYFENNVVVFEKLLAAVEIIKPKYFIFASSSSVYGNLGKRGPCKESDATGLNLKSTYAATKWINEIQAKDFTRRTNIKTLGLRFFTVYGPLGRPDMAYFKYLVSMKENKVFEVYGDNGGSRNYTYVVDAVKAIEKISALALSQADFSIPAILNIGFGSSTKTSELFSYIEKYSGMKHGNIKSVPRPNVDVDVTSSDNSELLKLIGIIEETPLEIGIKNFVDWAIYEKII